MGRSPRWSREAIGYTVAVLGTTVATALLLQFRGDVSKTNVVLGFLIVVVVAASAGGLGPGLVAAALGFLAFDVLFLPPYNTLIVTDPQDYLSLAVYLLTAVLVSWVVGALDRRSAQAERREREARTLYELSTSLVAHGSLDETLAGVVRTVRSLFGLAGCAIVLADGDGARVAASDGTVPPEVRERLVPHDGVGRAGGAAPLRGGIGGDLEPGMAMTVPMRAATDPVGALVVVAGGADGARFGEAERRLLATFANQAALAVEQDRQDAERARARSLVETDRLRTALLNSVSHDLRTPLASVKAAVSSLLDPDVEWDEAERREFLVIIDEAADRLSRLVHNLLDMSRIEAGALDPNLREVSLADIAGPVVLLARASTRQRIDVDLPEDLPPVHADPILLEQVLGNLLDNARRYAPGSPVTMTARSLPGGGEVEVRVVDHGPGIPVPERERVFDQFYRLKRGGKRPAGTGMGLAICRGIVDALAGDVRVETTPGGGATFVVTLQAATPGARSPEGRPPPPAPVHDRMPGGGGARP
jgi:two-component system sensor histidine kinase KdpD